MPELQLNSDQRLELKARAHHVASPVLLGGQGLTEAAMREIDRALSAHELIKVRVPGDDRDERERMFVDIAERLAAARVQAIGKVLVLYRPQPEEDQAAENPAARSPRSAAAAPKPPRSRAPSPVSSKPTQRDVRRVNKPQAPRQTRVTGKRGTGSSSGGRGRPG
jgi:putative YhbY family RNA-binding protein